MCNIIYPFRGRRNSSAFRKSAVAISLRLISRILNANKAFYWKGFASAPILAVLDRI